MAWILVYCSAVVFSHLHVHVLAFWLVLKAPHLALVLVYCSPVLAFWLVLKDPHLALILAVMENVP